ncbi:MAG: signal peptidase I [Clostridia bacterium]|nr:signal peptidase I [Clostridia bacterium]
MDAENKDFYEENKPKQGVVFDAEEFEKEYIVLDEIDDEMLEPVLEEKRKNGWLRELYEWTQAIAVALVVALIINQFFFAIVQVEGDSMLPTLHDDERLVISKFMYTPQNDDIVIVKSEALGKHIVKRVIATPGQEINIVAATGDVYVDGKLLDEPYIKEKIIASRVGTKYNYPLIVPEDTVFVLGDNRNNSQDSRSLGVIPYSEIVGKATLRILPFDKFGGLYDNVPKDLE